MHDLTLLVLSYNGSALLERCLASIPGTFDVVVIDNGSHEDIAAVCARHPVVQRIVRFEDNRGFAGAYNDAIDVVQTRYVGLLSNDTRLEPGCAENLVDALKADPRLGVVAPILINPDGSVQEAGCDVDLWGFPIQSFAPPRERIREVFFASGCLLVLETELFRRVGGFSRHLGFFVEDVDLCWKVRLTGRRVGVARDARMVHLGGATLGGSNTGARAATTVSRTFYRERNTPLVMIQNFGLRTLVWVLPLYAVNAIAECVALGLLRKWDVARAYVRAWRDIGRLLPVALRHRRAVQSHREVSDGEVLRFVHHHHEKIALVLRSGLPTFEAR